MTKLISFKGIDASVIDLSNNTVVKTVNVCYAINSAFKHSDDYVNGLGVKLFDTIYPVDNFYNGNEMYDLFYILVNSHFSTKTV